jgi:hypothetical protein
LDTNPLTFAFWRAKEDFMFPYGRSIFYRHDKETMLCMNNVRFDEFGLNESLKDADEWVHHS